MKKPDRASRVRLPSRWTSCIGTGGAVGIAVYAGLLAFHIIKFGAVEYRVPNVKVIIHAEGGYGFVGYGYSWELTALNGPALAVGRIKRASIIAPQVIRVHGEPVDRPRNWSPTAWVAVGALAYTFAGAAIGLLLWLAIGPRSWARHVRRCSSFTPSTRT